MNKKNLIKIAAASLFVCIVAGCASTGKREEAAHLEGHSSDIETPEDIVFITNDNTHDPSITFKKNYELNGCKYLNLELSSPNSGKLTVRIEGIAVPDKGGAGIPLVDLKTTLSDEFKIYQAQVFDKPVSYIDILKIHAYSDDSSKPVSDIIINIKSITPTNDRL